MFEGFALSPEEVLTTSIVLARECSTDRKLEKTAHKGGQRSEQLSPDGTTVVRSDAAWDENKQAAGCRLRLDSPSSATESGLQRTCTFRNQAVDG